MCECVCVRACVCACVGGMCVCVLMPLMPLTIDSPRHPARARRSTPSRAPLRRRAPHTCALTHSSNYVARCMPLTNKPRAPKVAGYANAAPLAGPAARGQARSRWGYCFLAFQRAEVPPLSRRRHLARPRPVHSSSNLGKPQEPPAPPKRRGSQGAGTVAAEAFAPVRHGSRGAAPSHRRATSTSCC